MIPKIIHYCWFGGNPLPELAKRCIASWKKFCPDYEIHEWNEDNFDVSMYDYTKEAYKEGKWAFVTDVVRLYALVNFGGIYMDTDVEVIRPLDGILEYHAMSGFESEKYIPTGLMACEKGHAMMAEFLDEYSGIHFLKQDGTMDLTTNVTRITNTCLKYGFIPNNTVQTVNGFTLLPKDYFCPKDYVTKKINLTERTLAIHHFDGSWLDDELRYAHHLAERMKGFPGILRFCKFIGIVKYKGLGCALKKTCAWGKKKLSE